MPSTTSRRIVTAGGLEWRADSDSLTLEGHASTFNQPYDMGWYQEEVREGAFTKTLSEKPDVRLLVNHTDLPLARTTSGTLQLSQDSSGLYCRAALDKSDPDVQRIAPKIARGDLDQMSFAFRAVRQEWDEDYEHRTLTEVSLADGDVSVVTYPANPNATFTARMRALQLEEPAQLRAAYRALVDERAGEQVTPATARRLRAQLESLAAEELGEDALPAIRSLLAVDAPASATETPTEPREHVAAGRHPSTARARLIQMQLRSGR